MIENGKTIEQLNYLSIITPQNTRISWDDYFSILAKMTSMRSSDKHRKVGSVIVSQDNRILSTGYNGTPIGIKETDIPWNNEGEYLNTKYPYIVHSELNAILGYNNNKALLKGARIYTTLFPCNNCMKAIIQSGISEVIYLDNHNYQKEAYVASRHLVEKRNEASRLPKIILRGYKVSAFEKNKTSQAINEDRIIIPAAEVAAYDETLDVGLSRTLKR